jgi:hypothetical protein
MVFSMTPSRGGTTALLRRQPTTATTVAATSWGSTSVTGRTHFGARSTAAQAEQGQPEAVIPDKPNEHEPWSEVGVAGFAQAGGSAVGVVDLRPEPFFAGTFGHIGSYPVLYAQ